MSASTQRAQSTSVGARPARLGRGTVVPAAALLALIAAYPYAELLARRDGGTLSGATGFVAADQLQYLAWIRDATAHGLAGNPFDLAPGSRDLAHPGVWAGALLGAAGLTPAVAYAACLLPAVAVLAWGTAAWVRRLVTPGGAALAALALALTGGSLASALVGWTGAGGPRLKADLDFADGELWPGTWLWGYPFTVAAVGLVPLALLMYERGRAGEGRARAAAAGCALLAAWLQPWQGATLALTVLAAELATSRRVRPAAPLVGAVAAPLVYYLALSRADALWRLAGTVNRVGLFAPGVLGLALAPLGAPALLGVAGALRAAGFAERALVAWPVAALAVYVQPLGTFRAHALQGLGIPLAVLAVRGLAPWVRRGGRARRLRGVAGSSAVRRCGRAPGLRGAAALVAVAGLAIPGAVYRAQQLRGAYARSAQPYVLAAGEAAALDWLAGRSGGGGVLAAPVLSPVVPARSGRETWLGPPSWTPDQARRRAVAEALFAGRLDASAARRAVALSGAAFLLADCRSAPALAALGGARLARRFGCAAVYAVGRGP